MEKFQKTKKLFVQIHSVCLLPKKNLVSFVNQLRPGEFCEDVAPFCTPAIRLSQDSNMTKKYQE